MKMSGTLDFGYLDFVQDIYIYIYNSQSAVLHMNLYIQLRPGRGYILPGHQAEDRRIGKWEVFVYMCLYSYVKYVYIYIAISFFFL